MLNTFFKLIWVRIESGVVRSILSRPLVSGDAFASFIYLQKNKNKIKEEKNEIKF